MILGLGVKAVTDCIGRAVTCRSPSCVPRHDAVIVAVGLEAVTVRSDIPGADARGVLRRCGVPARRGDGHGRRTSDGSVSVIGRRERGLRRRPDRAAAGCDGRRTDGDCGRPTSATSISARSSRSKRCRPTWSRSRRATRRASSAATVGDRWRSSRTRPVACAASSCAAACRCTTRIVASRRRSTIRLRDVDRMRQRAVVGRTGRQPRFSRAADDRSGAQRPTARRLRSTRPARPRHADIFVAGDLAYGAKLLIHAVASGKQVARTRVPSADRTCHRLPTTSNCTSPIAEYAREAGYETTPRCATQDGASPGAAAVAGDWRGDWAHRGRGAA